MKAKYALALAINSLLSPIVAYADWGNSSTYPFLGEYRKTTQFQVLKLDSVGADYSLPYIKANSLTST